ncbi:MAG: S49 family peptidase, partial [Smithellaceae bacterium]|nr:S49 family peptidase [Smithellaceae bacterium]
EILKLADGRVYTAPQALESRLIDRIGYLDDAVSTVKKSRNVRTAKVVIYVRPGAYRGTVYSEGSAVSPQVINLINVGGYGLSPLPGVQFLYLWWP